ncbi:hypothetical protein BD626DRAFT_487799 [Schizophyllum amplum]|uniref:Major facilitator superfamily (MFS) profile domain-containing protein n=1 Tax=Schizophyllum amplum TaxID=97359 RepID=A0A550CNY1_9AGAR|nr:hypothetical protein BD626DRAFT_487799 [Auriculariopsis ampla]
MADVPQAAPPSKYLKLTGQPLLYAISIFASLGVFLFGYDQGVMSGIITQPHFRNYFHTPTAFQTGTMVAVLEVGAFNGTTGYYVMIVGRIISGFGVGLLSTIVPIYQSEISPPDHRGALACMEFTGNIIGYSVSVWVGYFCSFIDSDLSWRIPLLLQCVIGAILAVGRLLCPRARGLQGMRVLADLHGGDPEDEIAIAEYKEIREKVDEEVPQLWEGRGYGVMWKKYDAAFAQLNGINARVFEEAGWIGREAILMTGINSIIYVLSTLPPWVLVDRWGRRAILLSGAVIMALALGATGWWMYIDVPATRMRWGPIPWLYPPEIMPLTFRAKGVSLHRATPILQEVIEWRLYPCTASSVYAVCVVYPETKGVPLEEMDAVFGEEEYEEIMDNASESDTESLLTRSGVQQLHSNGQQHGG